MKFSIFQDSRQGPRPSNQDRIAYAYTRDSLLAVLADGMGGHQHGEIAAQFAVEMLTEAFQRMATPALASPAEFLHDQIHAVHEQIQRHALLTNMNEVPCTTIVAAVVQHNILHCAHVGDSRLYHVRNGATLFCTEDHSKVQLLYRQGRIRHSEVRHHPDRHLIYNCVGGSYNVPQVEISGKRHLHTNDAILLCSDGFWSELAEDEIATQFDDMHLATSMQSLMNRLEVRAGQQGDNMSAIALRWGVAAPDVTGISTLSMTPGSSSSSIEASAKRHTTSMTAEDHDADIDYAIAEIQAALAKTAR